MTSGRRGPVNVDLRYNLFQDADEVALEPPWAGFNTRRSGASPDDVRTATDMLLTAARPVLFIGHGVTLSEASAELTALAHQLGIPVISSPNGMGCIGMADLLSLGLIRRDRTHSTDQARRHADL